MLTSIAIGQTFQQRFVTHFSYAQSDMQLQVAHALPDNFTSREYSRGRFLKTFANAEF